MLTPELSAKLSSCEALLIGASSGAIEALGQLLPVVPKDSRIPIVVVVHLPPNRPSLLPELFGARCAARVAEPEDKLPVSPSTIWFAPSNYHLLIEADRSFALSVDDPVRFSRPSIDVLFESAADAYGPGACAVVLTGSNDDAALGASCIRAQGGLIIVQDPATAESPQMPSAAIARANPQVIAHLTQIADLIRQATQVAP